MIFNCEGPAGTVPGDVVKGEAASVALDVAKGKAVTALAALNEAKLSMKCSARECEK